MTGPAPASRHPTADLDDVVHQRVRLGILTILDEAERVSFSHLKALLDLTAGNLGRHVEVLAQEGLVTVIKGYERRKPRTWLEITDRGRAALHTEIATLKAIVRRFGRNQAVDPATTQETR